MRKTQRVDKTHARKCCHYHCKSDLAYDQDGIHHTVSSRIVVENIGNFAHLKCQLFPGIGNTHSYSWQNLRRNLFLLLYITARELLQR